MCVWRIEKRWVFHISGCLSILMTFFLICFPQCMIMLGLVLWIPVGWSMQHSTGQQFHLQSSATFRVLIQTGSVKFMWLFDCQFVINLLSKQTQLHKFQINVLRLILHFRLGAQNDRDLIHDTRHLCTRLRWLVLVFSRGESIARARYRKTDMATCGYFCAGFNTFVRGYFWLV